MVELLKEKKILYRLIALVLVTIPLFGLLGGTPFLTFNFSELSNFLPGIWYVAITTSVFWMINITLILLAEKIPFLKKILLRALISIVAGLLLSTTIFSFFKFNNPRRIHVREESVGAGKVLELTVGEKTTMLRLPAADSNLIPPPPPGIKMGNDHIFFFPQILRDRKSVV